jgi:predicted lipoprotein with Yx(FWY)xxD motif
MNRRASPIIRAIAVSGLILSCIPARGEESALRNGSISYVVTSLRWATYVKAGEPVKCPNGVNDGPREQFTALYPNDGTVRSLANTQLQREIGIWFPTTAPDPFPFKEAGGAVAIGLNLDGKIGANDFSSPEGEPGIDNQLYRALGCINSYRDSHGANDELNALEVVKESYNRWMIEITGITSLENSEHVEVTVYRGLDPLRADAGGLKILPGGTQRIDARWGARFIQRFQGRIVNGVLDTDAADLIFPWSVFAVVADDHVRGARFHLKLSPTGAEGIIGGYADIEAWYLQLLRSQSTHCQSYGQLSAASLYKAMRRLADGYPDPATGALGAISSALHAQFTQVYILPSPQAGILPADQRPQFTPPPAHSGTLSTPSVTESFRPVPRPPGVHIAASELDGPVFTDPAGKTLYQWPLQSMRSGVTGDHSGVSECTHVKTEVSSGLMSPYPGGLRLPELAKHPSCTEVWPPFLASRSAKPVDQWSIITRKDGMLQWAYRGLPLYTSHLDRLPGDVLGGRADRLILDAPAMRRPVGPAPDLPPGFSVKTMSTGRLLVTTQGWSVYSSDRDTAGRSSCDAVCQKTWIPLLAPYVSRPHGSWSVIDLAAGVRQWTFHGKPLYRNALDSGAHRFTGSDVPGWHNVYTQRAPDPPAGFTIQDTTAGQVLADAQGRTVYTYVCGDDGVDQLGCDHPDDTQVYRLAICGGGDAKHCLELFPYVIAPANARSSSRSWKILSIDPMTGRKTAPETRGALRVWAYRDRPVYTYSGDHQPGDVNADSHGEFRGERNGFRAFWLRDDFFHRDQPGPG